MSNPITSTLESWLRARDMSMDEVRETYSISDEQVKHATSYIKISNLTMLHNPDTHSGRFYYKDGEFVLLYVGAAEVPSQLTEKMLEERLGGPGVILRSRVGKVYSHHVYPDHGVAFSSSGQDIGLVEIFPPTTLERYEEIYYEEPMPFIR